MQPGNTQREHILGWKKEVAFCLKNALLNLVFVTLITNEILLAVACVKVYGGLDLGSVWGCHDVYVCTELRADKIMFSSFILLMKLCGFLSLHCSDWKPCLPAAYLEEP